MIKNYILFLSLFSITIFSAEYDVGDIVSNAHQNVTKSTCFAGNDYGVGDDWKLADWNGATNGGHYTVIFIDMAATW